MTTTILRTCALALLAGRVLAADGPADVSLQKEIDHYLAAAAPEGGDPTTFRVFFKEGLKGETSDGNFKFHVGGRFMLDVHFRSTDDPAFDSEDTADGVFFRRLRVEFGGTIWKNIEYAMQVDFAKADFELKDVFLQLNDVPAVGMIRVGHFKEPMALEELTSSKYITFMERSMATNAFAPAHNVGLAVGNSALDKRLDWMAGVFRDTDVNGIQEEDGGYQFTARVTGIAFEDKERGLLVHVGGSFSLRSPHGKEFRARARPDTGSGFRIVDTGTIDAVESYNLFGLEFAVVWKSFSVQAEYLMADLDAVAAGDPSFSGYYVMLSYWITGESRPYKSGTFGRVKPKSNFLRGSGHGALEAAIRYGFLDLNDATITGGEATAVTVGLNWHLNPNTRVMLNIVFADEDLDGNLTIFEMRYQIDF